METGNTSKQTGNKITQPITADFSLSDTSAIYFFPTSKNRLREFSLSKTHTFKQLRSCKKWGRIYIHPVQHSFFLVKHITYSQPLKLNSLLLCPPTTNVNIEHKCSGVMKKTSFSWWSLFFKLAKSSRVLVFYRSSFECMFRVIDSTIQHTKYLHKSKTIFFRSNNFQYVLIAGSVVNSL